MTDPVSPAPSAVCSVQSRKRLPNSPTTALTEGLAHSPRVLHAVWLDVTETCIMTCLAGWTTSAWEGSPAHHIPCPLHTVFFNAPSRQLAGLWRGEDGVCPGLGLCQGLCPLLSHQRACCAEHCCSESCLIDMLDSILTIHLFLGRNEKFQFQSLACFSLTCFSQQVMALLCRSLKLPLMSLTRRCSKTPVLCRKCKERRDSFTPNVRGDSVKLTLLKYF